MLESQKLWFLVCFQSFNEKLFCIESIMLQYLNFTLVPMGTINVTLFL